MPCGWTHPTHLRHERGAHPHRLADAAAKSRRLGRPIHIIAESHDNDRRIVLRAPTGGLGLDAVWSDDFHHAVHVALTGERGGYYADFTDPALLPRAVAEGFRVPGQGSDTSRAAWHGFGDLPGEHFVIFVRTTIRSAIAPRAIGCGRSCGSRR